MDAKDYLRHPCPEHRRWGKKYPRYPGMSECVRLLKSRHVHGMWIEIICREMAEHAAEELPAFVETFFREEERIRFLVLTAITEAKLEAAIPFLTEVARQTNAEFSRHAIDGLKAIGSYAARKALWDATH